MEDTFLISTPFKSVKVHPVVLFTILNHYNRRPKDAEDVMGGTLLSFDSWRRNDSGFHQQWCAGNLELLCCQLLVRRKRSRGASMEVGYW